MNGDTPSLLSSSVTTLSGPVVAQGNRLAPNLTHSRRSTSCIFPSPHQQTGSAGDGKRRVCVPALLQPPLGGAGHASPEGGVGTERRGGEGAPAGDSRRAGLPGLRKARVPRGRLGLGVGAGGGGAAQRDPGWKPRGAPRPSRGACLFDCFGWRGDRTQASRGGERLGPISAEVGAGRSVRAAGSGRRRLRRADSRWGGAAAQTPRCPRARAGAGAQPPGRPVRGATGRARGVTAPPGFPLGGAWRWDARPPSPFLERRVGSERGKAGGGPGWAAL